MGSAAGRARSTCDRQTNTTKMFDEEIVVPDDYMLLGSQEKVTPNVPYKDYLTKNRTRVLGTTYVVSYAAFIK